MDNKLVGVEGEPEEEEVGQEEEGVAVEELQLKIVRQPLTREEEERNKK